MLGGSLLAGGAIGYVALADAGYQFPGSDSIRLGIDRHALSSFRSAPSQADIQAQAAKFARAAVARLAKEQRTDGWFGTGEAPLWADPWTTAQTTAGALAGELPESAVIGARALDALYSDRTLQRDIRVERGEAKLGWMHGWAPYVLVEPSLWVGASVARRSTHKSVTPTERRELARQWAYLDAVWTNYRMGGAWNSFAQQVDPNAHSLYASALALQVLADACSAGLEFRDVPVRRVAKQTTEWFWRNQVTRQAEAGWPIAFDDDAGPSLVFSVFVTAGLLRVEQACGQLIDAPHTALLRTVLARGALLPSSADTKLNLPMFYTDHHGRAIATHEGESIGVSLFPWLLQGMAMWGKRLQTRGGPMEDLVATRRQLARMLADLPLALDPKTEFYVLGETLYAIAQLR